MRCLIGVLIFLLAGLAAGCEENHTEATGDRVAAPIPVSVGYLPIADCAQLFVGIDKGFFNDAGLSIKALPLPSGVKILEATATKSIDVGFSAVVPLLLARSNGLDLVALTGGPVEEVKHPEHALLVKHDSTLTTARQLEGKTIAIVAFRSIDEVFVKEWLAQNSVNPGTVTFLEMPFPQMEPALLTGRVDAVATIEPFVTLAKLNNKTRVLGRHFIDVLPMTAIGSYNARRDWVANNTDAVQRFRGAFERATNYANTYPEETRSIIAKYSKLDIDVAKQITLPLFTHRLSADNLQTVAGLMVKWGIMDHLGAVQGAIYP